MEFSVNFQDTGLPLTMGHLYFQYETWFRIRVPKVLKNVISKKSILIVEVLVMDLKQEKKKIMMIVKMGMVLWIVGFLMVLSAIYIEFTEYKPTLVSLNENPKQVWEQATRSGDPGLVDQRIVANSVGPMLMTLKLGGIGFILSGIFLSLVAIVRALSMMPESLGMIIQKG